MCEVDSETGDTTDCVLGVVECLSYEFVHNEPIGGGGGGGSGTPGHDPGECDPMSTEPCHDGPGGSEPPPPEPDPCEEDNPPAYCECQETGNSVLDNKALQMVYEDLWDKQLDSNEEQGGFLYENALGDWEFFELTGDWVEIRTVTSMWFHVPSNLPEESIFIHTHPTQSSLEKHGITFEYEHEPSQDDRDAMNFMSSNHGVAYGVIIDPDYRILVGPDGNVITKEPRCGY